MERERDIKFAKKLDEWLLRENAKIKNKAREDERAQQREKEKHALIQADLNYDAAEEKRRRKRDPRSF